MRARLSALLLCLGLLLPGRAPAAAAEIPYNIDQRFGTIGFSISELGLFETAGTFRQFSGRLVIDPAEPAHTKIAVVIRVGSVAMSSNRAAEMLLSPAYFDAGVYPAIRFRSTSVVQVGNDRYRIQGQLRIRNVTQPETLMAVLAHGKGSAEERRTAYFTVTGKLHRSAFGMKANENFVGDVVRIVIHVHLALPELAHAG